jgi:hypothetical protein
VSDSLVFSICNYGVIPFWALLVLAPRWRWTDRLVHSALPAALLVPVYAWLLLSDDPGPQNASFFTLEGVMNIFTTPRTVAAGWIHYLVFDLFVGAWEARDARRHAIPQLALAPILVLTLLFGPVGLLAYLTLRALLSRKLTLIEG